MLYTIIAILVAFNMIVWKMKFEQGRYGDLALDFIAISILSMFFGHTLGGLVITAIAGTIISLYLYIFPPSFA